MKIDLDELEKMQEELISKATFGGHFDLDKYLRLLKEKELQDRWDLAFPKEESNED